MDSSLLRQATLALLQLLPTYPLHKPLDDLGLDEMLSSRTWDMHSLWNAIGEYLDGDPKLPKILSLLIDVAWAINQERIQRLCVMATRAEDPVRFSLRVLEGVQRPQELEKMILSVDRSTLVHIKTMDTGVISTETTTGDIVTKWLLGGTTNGRMVIFVGPEDLSVLFPDVRFEGQS